MSKKGGWISVLIHKVLKPFYVIPLHRSAFFVWTVLTLLGGLVGVLANIIKNVGFDHLALIDAIRLETINGSLYTYSIAIVASVLSSLFVLFEEKERLNFRYLQIRTAAISIVVLLFGGIFYAFNKGYVPSAKFDWKQFVILCISVVISVYVFCLSRLDEHNPYFEDISDQRYTKNSDVNLPEDLTNEGISNKKKEED